MRPELLRQLADLMTDSSVVGLPKCIDTYWVQKNGEVVAACALGRVLLVVSPDTPTSGKPLYEDAEPIMSFYEFDEAIRLIAPMNDDEDLAIPDIAARLRQMADDAQQEVGTEAE